jgi:serine/threonine-protein kinase
MPLASAPGSTYPGWAGDARAGAPRPPVPAYDENGVITEEEMRRWSAPEVERFRKKAAPFLIVNAVILILAIITDADFLFFTGVWSIVMAFQYAKLWSSGYDWRDVFKQPRDRLFADVVGESVDDAKALFDPKKRDQVRERARLRRLSAGQRPLFDGAPSGGAGAGGHNGNSPAPALPPGSPYAAPLRQALDDHAEIVRLVASMPPTERRQVGDVSESAAKLADSVRSLALTLSELDRTGAGGASEVIEREISALEAAANPLDYAASEERVRRLAFLKRQRRAASDSARRRDTAASRFESCRLALQNMRYDLVRLRTGSATLDQVTLVAERAMALARDVDGALEAAELARGSSSSPSRVPAQRTTRDRR